MSNLAMDRNLGGDTLQMNTDGGTVVAGSVGITAGDFVGRDKIVVITRPYQVEPPDIHITRTPLDATLYTEAAVVAAPKKLLGRHALMQVIAQTLRKKKRLLLTGLGGIGKTALAASFANQHIHNGRGPVVWIRCGNQNVEILLEAIGGQAEKSGAAIRVQAIQSVAGDAKIKMVREALAQSPITLIILDDTRDGGVLRDVQKAIPEQTLLLVTSRLHFATLRNRIEVGALSAEDALAVLSHYADRGFNHQEVTQAAQLCDVLGFHPYALELAGTILNIDEKTPGELLARISGTPHTVVDPDDKLRSISNLLNDSFCTLDPETQFILCALGSLYVPGATSVLLALYTQRAIDTVKSALDNLVRRSLAQRHPQNDYYGLHDLTFSYAKEKFEERRYEFQPIAPAIEQFVYRFAHDFDRLKIEQPNILGALNATEAELQLRIVSILTIGSYPEPELPSYFDAVGHTVEFLEYLDQTIDIAKRNSAEAQHTLHYLLSKRGNAYVDRGELGKALLAYQAALNSAPTARRKALAYAICGKVFALQEKYIEANEMLEQGYQLARTEKDDEALAHILGQFSFLAARQQDFEATRRFAYDAVETSRKLIDYRALAYALINFGSAELDLGITRAFAAYQETLDIAVTRQDDNLSAEASQAMGLAYLARQDFENAKRYLNQSADLYRKVGKVALEMQVRNYLHQFK